jgi:hypothetical protein
MHFRFLILLAIIFLSFTEKTSKTTAVATYKVGDEVSTENYIHFHHVLRPEVLLLFLLAITARFQKAMKTD